MKVMVTDKKMGVENEDDEWLRGKGQVKTHSVLSLRMYLSKALNPSFVCFS